MMTCGALIELAGLDRGSLEMSLELGQLCEENEWRPEVAALIPWKSLSEQTSITQRQEMRAREQRKEKIKGGEEMTVMHGTGETHRGLQHSGRGVNFELEDCQRL